MPGETPDYGRLNAQSTVYPVLDLGERAARVPTREIPLPLARILALFNPQLRALRTQLGQNFDQSKRSVAHFFRIKRGNSY